MSSFHASIVSHFQSSDEIVAYDQVFRPQYDFFPYITSDPDGHMGKFIKGIMFFSFFMPIVFDKFISANMLFFNELLI